MYAAEVWAGSCYRGAECRKLVAVQRRLAIRICRAYRTVSAVAVQALSSMIPIDLLIQERATMPVSSGKVTAEQREATIRKWSLRWKDENNTKALWTRSLIPDLELWIGRKHGEIGYAVAQCLTGHGCFRSYLHKMKIRESPRCIYDDNDNDTAEHTLFECTRWRQLRSALCVELELDSLTVDTLIPRMLETVDRWNRVAKYMEVVIARKEQEAKEMEAVRNR